MAGKRRLRMRGVKHSSKRLEDDLLDRARTLADNPGLLRPQCAGNCRKCVFDKTFKNIDSLQKIRNNKDALVKEASRLGGDDIVRAYAGTISLAAEGAIPMLASGMLGGEKVSYAVRGTVSPTYLIGCQYYDDPRKRLLLYNGVVKKNKLHLYSFGDDLVCSDSPNMPEDYLYDTFWETPYEFPEDGLQCGHETSAVLEIRIKSLGETIRICDGCARDVSTLMYIVSRLAAIDPLDDIEVSVRHKYHAAGESDIEPITGDRLKDYMVGKVTDSALISSVKRARMGSLKDGATATYIIGTKNYGSSLDDFIADLAGEEREKASLKKFLSENNRAVILKTNKVSEAYGALWDLDWKELIAAHTDMKTADAMGNVSKGQPLTVLANAYSIYVSADVVASLPEFKKPGQITTVADKLAKAAKVGGGNMVVETVGKTALKDSKSRVVAAAFAIATGMEVPVKLSADELDFAQYLVPFAKGVIDAQGEKYRDAMNTLLTASSAGEKV